MNRRMYTFPCQYLPSFVSKTRRVEVVRKLSKLQQKTEDMTNGRKNLTRVGRE